jgi:aminoglycoside phosphotransferase (APT) family kinase protein
MGIPEQRDLTKAREVFAKWLGTRLPGATDIEVGEMASPSSSGFSNETLLLDASWTEGGQRRTDGLVIRVKPTRHTVFMESEFEAQFKVMSALREHTDVPLPPMRWFEEDESWLGAPFYVMGKLDGAAPADSPPYTMQGFLYDGTPDQQATLWTTGIEAMAKVHNADWRALGFDFLDKPERGKTGLDQQLAYYLESYDWARQGNEQPVAQAALDWILANRPDDDGRPVGLVWGDSRIGNILFQDFRPVAVLDWEMVTLGDPQEDLAWWIFLDKHMAEGISLPRLPGFPSYDDTVAQWESLTGRTADHLFFYEVFAGFRFAVVMIRLAQLAIDFELLPPGNDMATNNIVTRLLASMLDLPAPGPAPSAPGY